MENDNFITIEPKNKNEINFNKEIIVNTKLDIKHNKRSISPIRKNYISQIDFTKKLKGTGKIKIFKN